MTTSYIHLCQVIKPVLYLARWFSIYPGHQCLKSKNHNEIVCEFSPSRFWIVVSLLNQILFIPFVLFTTFHSIYAKYSDGVLWFANVVNVVLHEVELYTILISGIVHAKRISELLIDLSAIPSCQHESKRVTRYLKVITSVSMFMFAILTFSYIGAIWFRRNTIPIFSIENIFESATGLFLRNYLLIFTQIQCIYIVMLSCIFTLKYEYLTFNVNTTLEKFAKTQNGQEKRNIIHIKPNGYNSDESTKLDVNGHCLKNLNNQFIKINDCLSDMNQCIGFQLLVTLTTDLYTLIFFIFRSINITKYNMSVFMGVNSFIGSLILGMKLILYMWAGHNIKIMIQTLLLQWSTTEAGSMSAFYLMDVGPWLLAPIVGNVITYLLVFIQYDMG